MWKYIILRKNKSSFLQSNTLLLYDIILFKLQRLIRPEPSTWWRFRTTPVSVRRSKPCRQSCQRFRQLRTPCWHQSWRVSGIRNDPCQRSRPEKDKDYFGFSARAEIGATKELVKVDEIFGKIVALSLLAFWYPKLMKLAFAFKVKGAGIVIPLNG